MKTNPLLCLFLLAVTAGCASNRMVQRPYSEVEARVLQRLKIDKEKLASSGGQQIEVDAQLSKWMTKRFYQVRLNEHEPGSRLAFTASWNDPTEIFGPVERWRFDLRKTGESTTRVYVDYSLRGLLARNPGMFRERTVARKLLEPPRPISGEAGRSL